MDQSFVFNTDQFNQLFPFYILLDKEGKIVSSGKSINKLIDLNPGNFFKDYFSIPRPFTPIDTFQDLVSIQNQLLILESKLDANLKLRGQIDYLPATSQILFVGSPWFGSMEQVKENNLLISDFAFHDPLIDLLHVLKTQEIGNKDLKELVHTIQHQKENIKKVNKEIHDIALFPMQNPDPHIRINFDGEILQNNPAAASMDFIEYEHKLLRNDEFFKLIADKIHKSLPRLVLEASMDDKVFSFLCVTMKEEGYINIYGRDITEKKIIEDQLSRLSLVAKANKDGVIFTDLKGNITWANESYGALIGCEPSELIGHSPVEICKGPLTDESTFEEMVQAFFNGSGFDLNIICYKKDGSWFWGHLVCQPLYNEKNQITEFFGTIRDVSDEKSSQEKLKVLSLIAEDNINAVIIADKEGKITWVNKSFVQMTGYTLEESFGKKPGHLLQGPESDIKTIDYLSNQIKKGEPFQAEILNYTKWKKPYWLRLQGQPIKNEKGELIGFFALEENITQEKENEGRFRKVLENIGDNVWEHDLKTGITYFSKSDNNFLGYSTTELTNNQELWWNSVHKEDLHLLIESDKKYKSSGSESHNLEYRIINRDGSIKWVLDRGVVIERDFTGKPLRITGTHTDITAIKHIESELANRVKQFQSLSENIPGVLYEYEFRKDGTEGLRYISPAIEKIFGIRPDQFNDYIDYIHPDDRKIILQGNKESRDHLKPFYAEARLIVPGKELKWHSVHSSFSYKTETGDDIFTGLMLDITNRKTAEQKLDEQRAFYEDILNKMPADIVVFNPYHQYLFVNPKAIPDDNTRTWVIGKKDEEYCNYRGLPSHVIENRKEVFRQTLSTKLDVEWEEKLISTTGQEHFLLRRLFPVLDKDKNVTQVIGYGIDITERKTAEQTIRVNEEKYRGIIDNMNLGLMEIDKNGKIDFANQTLLNMADLSVEEAVGYNAINFLHAESIYPVKQKMQNRSSGISEAYETQTDIKGKKGWWFVSSAPKYSSFGEHTGSTVICLDITKQKSLEQELIQSREQAELLAKTKEIFLANMSHEIRTPMNAIIGMGNQLGKTELNEQQSFYLNTIKTAAENLLVIVNDILDLSKIEAGKLTIEKIGFEPQKVIQNAIQVLLYKAEEKGLKLTNSFCDTHLANVLIGDPYRLNQVILNLMSNAIKFTEKGSVNIECRVTKEDDSSQTVRFSIIDTGIGMDRQFVEKLFDKFSQEYESISRKYGGTGLGMSICKELVNLMGGTIHVESEKGEGTTIQFEITYEKGSVTNLDRNEDIVVSSDLLKGKTILITDDNEMNRLVASTILSNYGAITMEASDGQLAIELNKENNPDLILMDIQMPVMNGYISTKNIRSQGYKAPIIALTANAIRGEHEKCLAAGMNDYISKPFKEEDFLRKIAHWLQTNLKSEQKIKAGSEIVNTKETQYFDLSGLRSISQGNENFVNKMIQLFIDQGPTTLDEMKKAYDEMAFEKVKKLAHRLKPSIDNLGIEMIKSDIREIEKKAVEYGKSEHLEQLISQVQVVITQVANQLKEELSKKVI